MAAYYEHVDLFVMLMTAGANITTALFEEEKTFYHKFIIKAAENGQLDRVKKLTENNPKLLDQPDQDGETPLIWAAYGGHADIVEYLISKGAKLNTMTTTEGIYKGRTPLHWAAGSGHNEVVEILLKHGAATYLSKPIDKSKLNSKVKAELELVEFIQKTSTTHSRFHFFGYSNKQKLDAANALKTVIFNDAKESCLDGHKEVLDKSELSSIYRNLK